MNKINKETIRKYVQTLNERGEADLTIKTKLSSIEKYIDWAYEQGLISQPNFKQIKEEIAEYGSEKKDVSHPEFISGSLKALFSAPLRFARTVLHYSSSEERSDESRSNQQTTQDSRLKSSLDWSIQHYIAATMLLLFVSALGAGLYNQFFKKATTPFAYPTSLVRGTRTLSFQGRMTDNLGNPITTATNVTFKLHTASSGGSELYTTGACSITPDQDGIFSSIIGQDCGAEIGAAVFTENANVYLGVTVASDAEMTPRQQIANVGYAMNAEALQGLPPGIGGTAPFIPYFDSTGMLQISVTSPTIKSTSGTFAIQGAAMTLTTTAGNISLVPTGGNVGIGTSSPLGLLSVGATNHTPGLLVNVEGNVGIGTTSPGAKLSIISGDNKDTGPVLNLAGTAVNQVESGRIRLTETGMGASPFYQGGFIHYDGFANVLNIGVHNASDALTSSDTNAISILRSNGNVGIGTTNPTAPLHIYNTADNTANFEGVDHSLVYITGTDTSEKSLNFVEGTTVQWKVGMDNGPSAAANYFTIKQTNNASAEFTIDTSGNFGLMADSPRNRLDINGSVSIGTTYSNALPSGTRLAINGGNVGIGTTGATSPFTFLSTTATGNIFSLTDNSLTTGNLLSLASTATGLTTGGLLNLNWNPASTVNATGDLVTINIGSSANVGNIFNITDASSSIFSVSENAVTTAVPANFTASGDVSIAYDINFTNPTASYIKSAAPLYIQAGKVFNSSDLTLRTFNSGDVVIDAAGGVTLSQAQNWSLASSTTALNFQNSSGGNILTVDATNSRVGIGTSAPLGMLSVGATNHTPALFVTANNGNVGLGNTNPIGMLSVGITALRPGLFVARNTHNVGIGSTDPQASLDVRTTAVALPAISASAQYGSSVETTMITAPNSDGTPFLSILDGGTLSSSANGWGLFYRATDGDLTLGRRNASSTWSETFRFQRANGNFFLGNIGTTLANANLFVSNASSGNVGIGTTGPSQKLHVVGASILANNTSIDPDSYTGTVIAGTITDGGGWSATGIGGNGSSTGDTWALAHNGTNLYLGLGDGSNTNSMKTRMYIEPGGNFGIGGTSAHTSALLWVSNDGNVSIGHTNPYGMLSVGGTNYTPGLFVTKAGNVGLGTTGPGSKLEVIGDAAVNARSIAASVAIGAAGRSGSYVIRSSYNNSGSMYDAAQLSVYGATGGYGNSTNFLGFDSATGESTWSTKMALTLSGNLGLGTTAPLGMLSVGTTNHTPGLFVANNTGNVGIGTTNPGTKLVVQSGTKSATADFGRVFTLSSDDPGTLAMMTLHAADNTVGGATISGYKSRGTNAVPIVINSGDAVNQFNGYGYDGASYIQAAGITLDTEGTIGTNRIPGLITFSTHPDSTSAATERMRINSSGNVGIGNTNPLGMLSVGITAYQPALFVATNTGNVGIGTTNPATQLQVQGSGGSTALSIKDTGTDSNPELQLTNDEGGWVMRLTGSNNDNLIFRKSGGANQGTFMTLAPGGNVGIGATTGEGILHLTSGSTTAQVDWSANDSLAYGSEKADLILTRRHADTNTNGLGRPASLIDFRATNSSNAEWSTAQILSVVDPQNGSNYQGGLMFLTSAGGTANPTGMRSAGTAPIVRMMIGATGNVGIGNTNPGALFAVGSGTNTLFMNSSGQLLLPDGAVGTPSLANYNDTDTGLFFPTNNGGTGIIAFTNDGAEKMRIDNNGNVGIGITTLSGVFQVGSAVNTPVLFVSSLTGNVGIGTSLPTSKLTVKPASNVGQLLLEQNNQTDGWVLFAESAKGDLTFSRRGEGGVGTLSERVRFANGGNVGIGATSPAGKLDVRDGNVVLSDTDVTQPATDEAGSATYGYLGPYSATAGGLLLYGLSDTDALGLGLLGTIGSNNPTDSTPAILLSGRKSNGTTNVAVLADAETVLQLRNYSTNLVTVLGSGNVGIGTSLPYGMLSVGATPYLPGLFVAKNTHYVGIGNSAPKTSLHINTQTLISEGGADTNGAWSNIGYNAYYDGTWTRSDTTKGGASLHFTSPVKSGGLEFRFRKIDADGNNALNMAGIGSSYSYISPRGVAPDFYINSVGNVGIGNSIPFGMLSVGTTHFQPGLFVATNTGNVGLGTTNPGAILDISGNQSTSLRARIINVGTGTTSQSMLLVGEDASSKSGWLSYVNNSYNVVTGTESVRTNSLTLGVSSGGSGGVSLISSSSAGPITFTTGGYAITNERMRVDNNGNVGIGTSLPYGMLSVGATALQPGLFVARNTHNVGVGTTNPGALLDVVSPTSTGTIWARGTNSSTDVTAGAWGAGIYLQNTNNTNNNYTGVFFANTAPAWTSAVIGINRGHNPTTTRTGDIAFVTSNAGTITEKMRITAEGNVGIGTTNPSQALEIAGGGTMKLSGGSSSGQGNIQFGATANTAYDTNLLLLTATNQTIGMIAGSNPTFQAASGPFFGARANNFTTIGNQRGEIFVAAGNVTSPVANEGSIVLFTGSDQPRLKVDPNGNVGIGTTSALGMLSVGGTHLQPGLFVNAGGNVGLGKTNPGSQFEIATGNISAVNAGYATGAPTFVARYDGPKPYETDYSGNHNGNLGQIGTQTGGVIFRPGKFGKGVQVAEATTNTETNPSFETGVSGYSYNGTGSFTQSSEQSLYGSYSGKNVTTVSNSGPYKTFNLGAGTYVASAWYYLTAGSAHLYWGGTSTSTSTLNQWVRLSVTKTFTDPVASRELNFYSETASSTYYIDGIQVEQKGYVTPYTDGSLGNGHAWTGTAHASTSTRTAAKITYPVSSLFNPYTKSGTIMAWFYSESLGIGLTNAILSSEDGNDWLFLRVSETGNLNGRWGNAIVAPSATVSSSAWHHAALTSNGTTVTLYLDGVSIGTASITTQTGLGNLAVGSNSYQSFNWLDGYVDDVAVFTSALSAQEIYSIYKSNAPIQTEDQSSVLTAREILPVTEGGTSKLLLAGSVSGNVGVGNTNPTGLFQVGSSATTPGLFVTSGGNAGIGTTSPALLLEVQGSSSPGIAIDTTSATDKRAFLRFSQSNTALWEVGSDMNQANVNNLHFRESADGSKIRLTLQNGGNVGVGTTNPTGLLHVGDQLLPALFVTSSTGNVGIGATSPIAKLEVRGSAHLDVMPSYQQEGAIRIGRSDGTLRYHQIKAYNDATAANNYLTFALHNGTLDSTTDILTILGSGNVGIGTTSPGTSLDILSTTTALQAKTSGAGNSSFVLNNTSATFTNSLFYGYTTKAGDSTFKLIDMRANGVEEMWVNGAGSGYFAGNVGIGTTNPTYKLEIAGHTTQSAAGDQWLRVMSSDANQAGVIFGDTLDEWYFSNKGGTTDRLQLDSRDTTGVMTWLQNGNVGIGTTSPNLDLHLSSGYGSAEANRNFGILIDTTGSTQATNNEHSYIQFSVPTYYDGAATEGLEIGMSEATGLAYFTRTQNSGTNANGIVINGSGNVGIGNTSPLGMLSVGATPFSPGLFVARNTGRVGVGTTAPEGILEVSGPGGFSDNGDTTNGIGNVPFLARMSGDSTAIGIVNRYDYAAFALNIEDSANSSSQRGVVNFYDRYNGTWNKALSLKNGNVGIGTTNPGKKLTVYDATQWSNFESSLTTSYGLIDITNTTNTLRMGIESSTGGSLVTGSTAYNSVVGSTGNYGLHLISNNAVRMTIANDGNVGIGTTGPLAKLHVNVGTPGASTITNAIRIQSTVGAGGEDGAAINFQHSSSADLARIAATYNADNTDLRGNLDFYTGFSTPTIKMRIAGSGNVGIGTTGPSSPLHIDPAAITTTASSLARTFMDNTNTITTNTGNTNVYGLMIDEPNITVGTTTPTNSASLYISGAATEATSNYSLWADSGTVQIDSGLRLGLGSGALSAGILTIEAESAFQSGLSIRTYAASERSTISLRRYKGSYAIPAAVDTDSDDLGLIAFRGYDGDQELDAAYIQAEVDGTPGNNDMPTRLVFSTTTDGATSPTERLRINNAGHLFAGNIGTSIGNANLFVSGASSGNIGIGTTGPSSPLQVTGSYTGNYNGIIGLTPTLTGTGGSQAALKINPTFSGMAGDSTPLFATAIVPVLNVGGTATSMRGIYIDDPTLSGGSLTTYDALYLDAAGATNNRALYINTPTAGANNYAIYSAASAQSYFAGNVGIGTTGPLGMLSVGATNYTPGLFVAANNGNVGIGRTSPLEKLHIEDGSLVLRQSTGANDLSKAVLKFAEGNSRVYAFQYDGLASSPNNLLRIRTDADGSDNIYDTEIMAFNQNGNVGIGNTNLIGMLSVGGSYLQPGLFVTKAGNVGIGTTSNVHGYTGSVLTVLSGSAANSMGILELGSQTADADDLSKGDLAFVHSATTDAAKRLSIIRGATDGTTANNRGGQLKFFVQNDGADTFTQALTIRQTGNVGIGTSAPAQALGVYSASAAQAQFNGYSLIGGANANSGSILIGTTANILGGYIDYSQDGNSTLRISNKYEGNANSKIQIGFGNTNTPLTILQGGKVGIVSASPQNRLDVNGAVSIGTTYPDALPSGTILAINGGNVGIGTTTPQGKLEIFNSYLSPSLTATPNGGLIINGLPNENVMTTFGVHNNGTAAYSWIQSRHPSSATYLPLTLNPNGGNVSIGTTTPAKLLQVGSLGGDTFTYTGDGLGIARTGNTTLAIRETTNNVEYDVEVFSTGAKMGLSSNHYLSILTNNLTRMTISSDGNVGIGTSLPYGMLSVGATNYQPGLFVANNTGNVGIGTTSTPNTLSVYAGTSIPQISAWGSSGTGAKIAGYNLKIDTTDLWQLITDNASSNSFFIQYNNIGVQRYFSVLSGGNVGIGTTNPAGLLHVGSQSIPPLYVASSTGNVGIGITSPGAKLSVLSTLSNDTSLESIAQIRKTSSNRTGLAVRATNSLVDLAADYGLGTPGGVALSLSYVNTSNNFTEGMRITSNGNVGIGTSLPYGMLSVGVTPFSPALFVATNTGNIGIGTTGASSPFTFLSSIATGNIFSLTDNSLTTGNLLSLASTATGLTTGGLLNLNWNPASTVNATGDLVTINIGSSANVGNIFNITDASSSIFSVSENAVTTAVPANFTASGDVSIAYDINFTNPTASYIKSAAPLYIQAGEVFNSSDLTLRTFNSGDVVIDAAGGVTLSQAQNWSLASSTTALNFQNSSGGNILTVDATNSRVGIGTSAPLGMLSVGATNYTPGLFVANNTGNVGIGITNPSGIFQVGSSASVPRLLIESSSGNVGIGTTDLGNATLNVTNVNASDDTIYALNTSGAYAIYAESSGGTNAGAAYIHSTTTGGTSNALIVKAETANSVSVTSLNSIYALATVGTGSTVTNNYTLSVYNPTNSGILTNNYGVYVDTQTAGTNDYGVYVAGADSFALYSAAGTNYFGGNVGIGNTNPLGMLSVGATPFSPGLFVAKNTGNVGMGTTGPGGALQISSENNSGQMLLVRNYATGTVGNFTGSYGSEFRHATNGSTTHGMLINMSENNSARRALDITSSVGPITSFVSNGNVGIGTSTPLGLFHVGAQLTPPLFVASSTGNVGIGTTNPGMKLEVVGPTSGTIASIGSPNGYFQIDSYGSISDTDSSVVVNDSVEIYNATLLASRSGNVGVGISTITPQARLHIRGVGTTNNWAFHIDDGTATDRLVVFDNGNVGIGNTNPLGMLSVGATALQPALFVTNNTGNVGLGTTNPAELLEITKSGGGAAARIHYPGTAEFKFGIATGENIFRLGPTSANANLNTTNAFTMSFSTGNIGLGTTNPQGQLHVAGATSVFGAGEGGTPTATTIRGAAAGGTNIAGADLTFDASNGTGSSTSGNLIFRTAGTWGLSNPVTVGAGTSQGTTNYNLLTWNHSVVAGSNKILIVNISKTVGYATTVWFSNTTNTLTKLMESPRAEIWYLLNPTQTPNQQVGVSWSTASSVDIAASAVDYSNVYQTTPFGVGSSATTNSTSISINVSSSPTDMVIDNFSPIGATGTVTYGVGQTMVANTTFYLNARTMSSMKQGATSLSWTTQSQLNMDLLAVPLKSTNAVSDTLVERMRIDPNGNVGIGTTNPGQKLDVVGTIKFGSGGYYSLGTDPTRLEIRNSANDSIALYTGGTRGLLMTNSQKVTVGGDISGGASLFNVQGGVSIGSTYYAAAAPTNGLLVEGNVGIGNSNPLGMLSVGTTNYLPGLYVARNTHNVGIGTTNPLGPFMIGTNQTAPVLFASSLTGNIGIGTSFPQDKLNVNGNVRLTSGANYQQLVPGVWGLGVVPSAATTGNLRVGSVWEGLGLYSGDGSAAFDLILVAASGKGVGLAGNVADPNTGAGLWVTSGNNVGIGHTNPLGMLSVGATNHTPGLFVASNTGNVGVGNTNPLGMLSVGATALQPALFVTNNTGNVGIGTTNPGARLEVYGSTIEQRIKDSAATGSPKLSFYQTTTERAYFQYQDSDDSFDINTDSHIDFMPNNTQAMRIASDGNVGIGTATPLGILSVGATNHTPGLFVASNTGNVGVGITNPITKFEVATSHASPALFVDTTTSSIGIGASDLRAMITLGGNNPLRTGKPAAGIQSLGLILNPDSAQNAYAANFGNETPFTINSPSGGVAPLYAGIGVIAPIITLNGTAQVSKTAALYVERLSGVSTNAASDGISDFALYVANGKSAFNGNLGIGTTNPQDTLHVKGGLCVQNTTACPASSAGQINYDTGASLFDLAEEYNTGETVEAADVVITSDSADKTVIKSTTPYQSNLIGIVSTNPNIVFATGMSSLGGIAGDTEPNTALISLSGRVPIKVTTENGSIKRGDLLTSSSTPGVAMKATKAGATVAKALEDYDNSDPTAVGKIMAFVNTSWYDSDVYLTSTGNLSIGGSAPNYTLTNNITGQTINRIGAFSEAAIAILQTGSLDTQSIKLAGVDLQTTLTSLTTQIESLDSQLQTTTSNLQTSFSTGSLGIGVSAPDPSTSKVIDTSTGAYLSAGGVWTNTSDVNLKENFTTLNDEEILEKIGKLNITEWNYKKEDASVKHIGPVAQDFYKIFGLGGSDKTISTIDPAGVALAGIQGLIKKVDNLINQVEQISTEMKNNTLKSVDGTLEKLIVKEKIISPVIETQDIIATGTAKLNEISTNTIKPQDKDVTIDLSQEDSSRLRSNSNDYSSSEGVPTTESRSNGPLAKLMIKGLEGKTVASIDAAGNASFSGIITANEATISGTLTAQTALIAPIAQISQIEANEATISGTLTAQRIEAENITELEEQVDATQTTLTSQTSQINDIQSLLAKIKEEPLPSAENYQNLDPSVLTENSLLTYATDSSRLADARSNNIGDYSSSDPALAGESRSTLTDLTVSGKANLYDVAVTSSLLAGNVLIKDNSILSLAWELKLSALSTINLFDGAVVIAKNGTITTKGELIAEGGIKTNTIQAVDNNDDINVILNSVQDPATSEAKIKNSKLKIENYNGDEVASIDASGSARFNSLSLNKYLEATSSASIVAARDNFYKNGIYSPAIETTTETAGIGIVPENTEEIIVYNENIKKDSLIYLTPTSQISPISLTVLSKEDCSEFSTSSNNNCRPYFKVAPASPTPIPIKFNWLIIN